MNSRHYTRQDEAAVCSLHERSCVYPKLDLYSPLLLAKTVVEVDNKIIGFGCLRLTSEAIIAVDTEVSKRVRVLAVEELIRTGVYQCQKLGLKDMHAFLTGPGQHAFASVLKRHYGFNGHSSEEILVLEV